MHELWTLIPADGWSRFLFDAAWQSTLLGLVVWLLVRFWIHWAAARAWFALLAVGLSLAMPAFSAAVRWTGFGLMERSATVAERPAAEELNPVSLAVPRAVISERGRPTRPASIPDELTPVRAPVVPRADSVVAEPETPQAQSPWQRSGNGFLLLGRILGCIWAIASIAVAMRLVASLFELHRLLGETRPCDDPQILAPCRRAAARLGLKRLPPVETSGRIALPALAGLGRAHLLIPERMLKHPSPDWLNVFCHELAHLRRGDAWGRLLVELVRVALPWQPLVWVLGREYLRACEEAADDWVVWTGTDPLDLATTLTNWAAAPSPRLATAVIGMSEPKWRILRLARLGNAVNPRVGAIRLWGCTTAIAVFVCLLALFQAPQRPVAAEELHQATMAQTNSEPPAKGADQAPAKTGSRSNDLATELERRVDSLGDPLPEGCLMRLGTIRLRHRSSLKCVTFSPDGTMIASAATNQDNSVSLWDVKTGRLIRPFNDPKLKWGWTTSVAFSPDGEQLASGQYDGSVLVWEVKTGRLASKAKRHEGEVGSVTFAPDGKRLASGGQDGRVCVGLVAQAAKWKAFDCGERPEPDAFGVRGFPGIRGLAFSPSGNLLAAGIGNQRAICIWDLGTGNIVRRIERAHGQYEEGKPEGQFLHGVAFLPDGKQLVSGGCAVISQARFGRPVPGESVQVPEIRFWDVATGKQVRELKPETPEAGFGMMAMSANGQVIASGIDDAVRLWDVTTGKSLGTVASSGDSGITNALAISPDGKTLAGLVQNRIGLWDVARRELIPQELPGHAGEVRFVTCSRDGATVASGGVDGQVIVWDAKSGRPLYEKSFGRHWVVEAMAMSANGEVLAACGSVSAIGERPLQLRCWKAKTGELLREIPRPRVSLGDVNSLTVSSDGQLVAAGGNSLTVSPDGRLGSAVETGISVWEISSGRKRAELRAKRPLGGLSAMEFSSDSKTLYAVNYGPPTVSIWDIPEGKLQRTFAVHLGAETGSPPGPQTWLSNAVFSADLNRLITRQNRTIVVWDVTNGKPLSMADTRGNDAASWIDLSADGRLLATTDHLYAKNIDSHSMMIYAIDSGGNIRLWEPESERTMQAIASGDGRVMALALSPDHKRLITAMDRGTVLVWDLEAAKVR